VAQNKVPIGSMTLYSHYKLLICDIIHNIVMSLLVILQRLKNLTNFLHFINSTNKKKKSFSAFINPHVQQKEQKKQH